MKLDDRSRKWLEKKARIGFRGHPLGTIACYGPDDRRASKMVVSVFPAPDSEAIELRRWFCESVDVRADRNILAEVVQFLRARAVRSIAMVDGLIGCPQEEGIDYPEGDDCPQCPFWADRDRWSALKRRSTESGETR